MNKLRLSKEYIESLITEDVKENAVYNFLGTLPSDSNYLDDLGNLEMDGSLYRWNAATHAAIYKGIKTYHNQ